VRKLNESIRKQLIKIIFWQLMIVMGLALLVFLLQGLQRGWSALLGGLAYWLPTFFFVWRVSAYAGAHAAVRFVVALFSGEMIKLFLSATLFLFAVKYLAIDPLYGVIGLIGSIVAFWITSVSSLYRRGVKA
jgi:ATP synthase protein I